VALWREGGREGGEGSGENQEVGVRDECVANGEHRGLSFTYPTQVALWREGGREGGKEGAIVVNACWSEIINLFLLPPYHPPYLHFAQESIDVLDSRSQNL